MPGVPAFGRTMARLVVVMMLALVSCACSGVRYYAQAVHGQATLIMHRQPLDKVLRDPTTDARLVARLRQAQQARRFASQRLALPDNRSYTGYVALDRPYVAWNVFATPRFSVHAVPQCFPVAGCVAYRGWFSESAARADAERLQAGGYDVWVGGVPAYSTLGWFADPILSSMLREDDDGLAGMIFHELAHQLVYVKGDTVFNESFATFVQTEGLRQWRQSRGLPPRNDHLHAMDEGFTQLVLSLRGRLETLYASGLDEATMAAGKHREIAAFRVQYQQWRDLHWPNDHRYDAWVAGPINNARLLPFGLYQRWVPAFAALFAQAEGHWPAFHARVRELAQWPRRERDRELQALQAPRY